MGQHESYIDVPALDGEFDLDQLMGFDEKRKLWCGKGVNWRVELACRPLQSHGYSHAVRIRMAGESRFVKPWDSGLSWVPPLAEQSDHSP